MRRGVNQHRFLLTTLGVALTALAGCATARTEAVRTEARCYPHIYLDNRYAIHGTYGGSGPATDDGDCYRFVYQDGRIARVDYRRGGTLSPDPSFGVASLRVEYSGSTEKRSFLGPDGRPAPSAGGELLEDKTSGLAIVRWQYDAQGRTVEESHRGPNEQLKADGRRGVAIVRWRYDRQGNTL